MSLSFMWEQVYANVRATMCHEYLTKHGIVVPSLDDGSYCFRIVLDDKNPPRFKLSISCPPGTDTQIETALIYDNKLYYNEELGYEDIRRFRNEGDIIDEIKRLRGLIFSGQLVMMY